MADGWWCMAAGLAWSGPLCHPQSACLSSCPTSTSSGPCSLLPRGRTSRRIDRGMTSCLEHSSFQRSAEPVFQIRPRDWPLWKGHGGLGYCPRPGRLTRKPCRRQSPFLPVPN
ncbi:hypothetical protein B0H63DRAFT_212948 [Podospora didyma]|uniref:Secreted protein n=1 Tax=Podospora didyma TaxID=330526 RepID=A0AAE0TW67_9PEZI|nr:hypothetical protein B0H63DRAFT_212948 [Podospora didyma]